jgi:hypothetical protein
MGVPSHGHTIKRQAEQRNQLWNETSVVDAVVTIQKVAIICLVEHHASPRPFLILVAADDRRWRARSLPPLLDLVMAQSESHAVAILVGGTECAFHYQQVAYSGWVQHAPDDAHLRRVR